MATMVRKQVYLEPNQNERLKAWAEETGKSEAAIIREALDRWLEQERKLHDTEEAWEEVTTYVRERAAQGPVPGGRTWTREELYEDPASRDTPPHRNNSMNHGDG
jgi:predicted DNA-binding protein